METFDPNDSQTIILNELKDEEYLLRLEFHPHNFTEEGKLRPSAISSDDLKTRGYSLDRESMKNIDLIRERASRQAESQARRDPEQRVAASVIIKFLASEVRNLRFDSDNSIAVELKADPIPENAAHAILLSNKKNRMSIEDLRLKLSSLFHGKTISLEQYASQI